MIVFFVFLGVLDRFDAFDLIVGKRGTFKRQTAFAEALVSVRTDVNGIVAGGGDLRLVVGGELVGQKVTRRDVRATALLQQ